LRTTENIFSYVKITIISFLFCINLLAQDSLKLEWERHFPGINTSEVFAYDMVLDENQNIYITGTDGHPSYGSEIITLKYTSEGALKWVTSYIGVDSLSAEPVKIALDPLGNIYVAGKKFSKEGKGDYMLIKYKRNGGEVWVREYNSEYNLTDWPHDLATDKSGNIYVTGYSYISSINRDYLTLKYNSSGVLQWAKRYSETETTDDRGQAIAVDDSGNVYVTGYTTFDAGSAVTIKYDTEGQIQWIKKKADASGEHIKLDTMNNIYIYGRKLIKYDLWGREIWFTTYMDSLLDYMALRCLELANNKNLFLTGYINLGNPGNEFLTLKYNLDGNLKWAVRYNDNGNAIGGARSIVVDTSGNSYVAGVISGNGGDIILLKYDPDGFLENVTRYDYSNESDQVFKLALDKYNNIYIFGHSYIDGYSPVVLTLLKYSQGDATGILQEEPLNNIKYHLYQNYPNPFNPETRIKFQTEEFSNVTLIIYDNLGRIIKTLINKEIKPGNYDVIWDGTNELGKKVSTGVYYYSLQANNFFKVKKMILIR